MFSRLPRCRGTTFLLFWGSAERSTTFTPRPWRGGTPLLAAPWWAPAMVGPGRGPGTGGWAQTRGPECSELGHGQQLSVAVGEGHSGLGGRFQCGRRKGTCREGSGRIEFEKGWIRGSALAGLGRGWAMRQRGGAPCSLGRSEGRGAGLGLGQFAASGQLERYSGKLR